MLRIYRHRVNDVATLAGLDPSWGIEFDLRSDGQRVIVTHDPFTDGPTIEEFFPRIGLRPCIFNVKCEGIEERVRALAEKHGIDDFFFLDCSVPAAMKLARAGEKRIAVRYSEVEPVEGVLAWKGKATWVWVDCFTRFPTDQPAWGELTKSFRLCLVSPELEAHGADEDRRLRASLTGLRYDAVCTKKPEVWA
jgi:hypothetical protein